MVELDRTFEILKNEDKNKAKLWVHKSDILNSEVGMRKSENVLRAWGMELKSCHENTDIMRGRYALCPMLSALHQKAIN